METKFTKAPWLVEKWGEGDETIETGSKYFINDGHHDICYLSRNKVDDVDLSINDAYLIAAAPELYELLAALECDVNTVDYCLKNKPENFHKAIAVAKNHAALARELLAKARGEQP